MGKKNITRSSCSAQAQQFTLANPQGDCWWHALVDANSVNLFTSKSSSFGTRNHSELMGTHWYPEPMIRCTPSCELAKSFLKEGGELLKINPSSLSQGIDYVIAGTQQDIHLLGTVALRVGSLAGHTCPP